MKTKAQLRQFTTKNKSLEFGFSYSLKRTKSCQRLHTDQLGFKPLQVIQKNHSRSRSGPAHMYAHNIFKINHKVAVSCSVKEYLGDKSVD